LHRRSRDLAAGIVTALERGRIGECYVLGHENLTYREALSRICSVLGVRSPHHGIAAAYLRAIGFLRSVESALTRKPPELGYTLASMMCDDCYYSAAKAVNELGMPQTTLERAAEEARLWYRNKYLVEDLTSNERPLPAKRGGLRWTPSSP